MTLTPLYKYFWIDRYKKRKSTAVAIEEEEETHFNFDCMF